jgi:hypothetical protein
MAICTSDVVGASDSYEGVALQDFDPATWVSLAYASKHHDTLAKDGRVNCQA